MLLTRVLMKKPKSKDVMVLIQSMITGHKRIAIRPRLDDKLEKIDFDPWIQMDAPYKELKRIRSLGKKE